MECPHLCIYLALFDDEGRLRMFLSGNNGFDRGISISTIKKLEEEANILQNIKKDIKQFERIAYPNPNDGSTINIRMGQNDDFDRVLLFDNNGNQYNITDWIESDKIVQIHPNTKLPSGILVIMLINEKTSTAYYSKIIKI